MAWQMKGQVLLAMKRLEKTHHPLTKWRALLLPWQWPKHGSSVLPRCVPSCLHLIGCCPPIVCDGSCAEEVIACYEEDSPGVAWGRGQHGGQGQQ